MSESQKINEGTVTSLSDTDLVLASDSSGTLRPISVANLQKLFRDTLQIGGRNLLKGTSDGAGWERKPSNGVFTISTSSSGEITAIGPVIAAIEPGKTYTVSFYAKATPNMRDMDIFLSATTGGSIVPAQKVSTEWKRYVFTKTLGDSFPIGKVFRIDNNGSIDGQLATLWVKDIKVEEGNIATAWTPAPEDLGWGG